MTIEEAVTKNMEEVRRALDNDRAWLVPCVLRESGEPGNVLCGVNINTFGQAESFIPYGVVPQGIDLDTLVAAFAGKIELVFNGDTAHVINADSLLIDMFTVNPYALATPVDIQASYDAYQDAHPSLVDIFSMMGMEEEGEISA